MRNKIIAKTQAKNPYIIESDNEIVSNHSSDNEIEVNIQSNNKDDHQSNINKAYVHSTSDLSKISGDESKHDKKDDNTENT